MMSINEYFSPSAIPQIKHQVAHESDVAVFHVDSSTQSADILCDIVAEYHGPHGRLARARSSH